MNGTTITKDMTKMVLAAIADMSKAQVKIGIPEAENTRQDIEETENAVMGNAAIGYVNEFGSAVRNIPARPFLVPGVESVSDKCANILKNAAAETMDGVTDAIDKGMNAAGMVAQSAVKNYIVAGDNFEQLSEKTIKERRAAGIYSEKPLIRTGQLLNSIKYVVESK